MKKKILSVILSIICVTCLSLFFVGCNNENDNDNVNKDEQIVAIYNTYVAYAEENGQTPLSYENWLVSIKGEKGDKGDSGTNGQDGKTPTIEIIDGYWYINGENTDVKAEGKDGINGTNGTNGTNGATPTIEIIDGYWYINGENTDVKAEGKDGVNGTNGTNGVDGKTPTIEIIDGYWYINGDNTGVKAKGQDGLNGMNGKGIKSAVIDSNGDLIITFDDNTWVNAGNIVPKNPILDENNKIIFNNISIEDNNGFIKVENGTTTFSFLDEIEIRGNANYTVSTDITGLNVIPTKTVNLEIGDNVLYVLETCGNDANLYTITIRRDLHTVTFNTNGGTAVEPILVNTGEMITAPTSQRNGYGLSWDFDFETPITEDITINATWTAIFTADGGTITGLTEYGKGLSDIVIPNAIDKMEIVTIGERAFENNKTIKNVVIMDGITNIKRFAFLGCEELTNIELPLTLMEVGYWAFMSNNSKIVYTESEGLKYLGNNYNKYLYLAGVIDRNLSTANINSNCKIIGYEVFSDCLNLEQLDIPNNVARIEEFAFVNCDKLQTIEITNSVTSIGTEAFAWCDSLSSVIIGKNVETISDMAFLECYALKDIFCYVENKPIGWHDNWNSYCPATVHWGYKGE